MSSRSEGDVTVPTVHSSRATPRYSTGALERRPRPERPPSSRPRQKRSPKPSYVRLLYTAAFLLAATWLPGILGGVPGLAGLGWWGQTSGYLGLSWAAPAILIGLAAGRAVRRVGLPGYTAAGGLVGLASAFALLLGAAQIIGG
jgi:hypothetical protein